ncbi:1083_t:CDS:2 [Dentiscutata heterogama]|uniref:1083_t:CDS:1 n=1 Tax=Dentiscutata heterogama TaxID=1316150 RepID=A0ACA9M7Y9_9GLOM|nr:1083_t:CDS:2 [Dentiscutata heterogama]
MVENKEWLEKAIAENYINILDYADFIDFKHIGDGSFATVRSANWKSRGTRVALKSLKGGLKFDDVAMKEFMRELKLLRKVNYHPNINQFLGVIKEYADGGSLRDFLRSKFETLKWTDKFRIATEIARGLGCLHAEEIIHRELDTQLHSNNNTMSVYKSSSTRSSFENDDSRNDVAETLNTEVKPSIYSSFEPRNTAFSEISNFQICNQAVNTRRRSLSPVRGNLVQPSREYWKEKLSVIKENYTVNLSDNLSLEEETYSKLSSGTKPMLHVNKLYSFSKKCPSRSKNLKQTVSTSDFKITNSYSPDDQFDNPTSPVFNQEIAYHQKNDFVLYNGKPMESITPVIDDMHAIVIKEQPFFIPYSQFNIIAPLDYGYLGRSFKVYWKKANNIVALKKLYLREETQDSFLEDFLKEIKIHSNIEMCKNINRLLGITHDVVNNIYMLITEYADKGNLRKYLKNNSSFMTWKQKVDFALQITNGIQYLHSENIIHGNLDNSKSVGLSKSTDIYSLGILYWELVSGYPPFKNSNETKLVEEICAGKRERRIPGTPDDYFELYSECWSGQPESRPNVEEIYRNLTKMIERINREEIAKNTFYTLKKTQAHKKSKSLWDNISLNKNFT